MSSIGVKIHYSLDPTKQGQFCQVINSYFLSEKTENDQSKYIQDLKSLGIDTTYALGIDIYNFGFADQGSTKYEFYSNISGTDWWDIILPMLSQLGASDIFAYAHDTSWGGDVFFVFDNGKTEEVYTSGINSELDSFLYDETGDYIGTSFDILLSKYRKGDFDSIHQSLNEIASEPEDRAIPIDVQFFGALIKQNVEAIEAALIGGASMNIPLLEYINMSPLEIAINYDNAKIVELLLKYNALETDKFKTLENCWAISFSLGCHKAAKVFKANGAKTGVIYILIVVIMKVIFLITGRKPINLREKLNYENEEHITSTSK